MKTCPGCGAQRPDQAKFCAVCGQRLPASPTALPPAAPPPPKQQAYPQIQPPSVKPQGQLPSWQPPKINLLARQPRSWLPQLPSQWTLLHGSVLADGLVNIADPPRTAKLPPDPARMMIIAAISFVFLGAIATVFVAALTIFIVLLIFGVSLCLLPILMLLLGSVFGPVLALLRGRQTADLQDFQVMDEIGGAPVSVVIYQREGTSSVRLGDWVRVFGHKQWNSNEVRAYRVEVYESNGQHTKYTIRGLRPWPLWIGLIALGLIAIWVVQLYNSGGF